MTAEEFARGKPFAARSLHWWASELGRRERGVRRSRPRATLARVVPPGAAPRTEPSVTLVVGGATIVVKPGFDDEFLRQVVHALAEGE